MDSESFEVPGLGTLRRQVTRLPSSSGGENVLVSWEGHVRLPGGERAELFVGEADMVSGDERRHRLVGELTHFFTAREEALRREVAADLLGLVNTARAIRESPAPALTLETLLPRLTLEDVAWDDGRPSATYRLDEPEFGGHTVRAEVDEAGRVQTRTSLREWLPVRGELSAAARETIQGAEAARAALEDTPSPFADREEDTGEAAEIPGLGTLRRHVHRTWAALWGEPPSELVMVSWKTTVRLPGGEEAEVSVGEDAPLTPDQVRRAGERIAAFLRSEPDARRRVAAEMLDLAQHWWEAPADESPLTLEAFLAKLRLESVVTEDDGDLTVYYDDAGEVFAGHAIQAVFDADLNLIDTDIPG